LKWRRKLRPSNSFNFPCAVLWRGFAHSKGFGDISKKEVTKMVDKTEEPKKEKGIGRLVLAERFVSLPWIMCQLLLSLFILIKRESSGATSRDMSLIDRFCRYAGW